MIDPEKLRREIDEVWVTLGQQANAEGHEVMRACALTLIVAADEDADPDALAETLAALMREHPSRAIVIRLAAGAGDLLEASVDARCWMPFGGRQQICSEQIVIRCTEKTLTEAPGVILPLVAADLPVVLWCASDCARRSEAFAALAEPAGRVILDIVRSPDPAAALAGLAAEIRQKAGTCLRADLSWTRLTRWRALLAQVFENELYRRQLPRFSEMNVCYEGPGGGRIPITALLLAGWLTSRLGWQAEGAPGSRSASGAEAVLSFRRTGGEAQLRFCRRPADCRMPRLVSFDLLARDVPPTRVAVARTGEVCGEVTVDVAGLEPVMNRVSLVRSTDVLLLGEELSIYRPDPVFEQSLESAAEIARLASPPGVQP